MTGNQEEQSVEKKDWGTLGYNNQAMIKKTRLVKTDFKMAVNKIL